MKKEIKVTISEVVTGGYVFRDKEIRNQEEKVLVISRFHDFLDFMDECWKRYVKLDNTYYRDKPAVVKLEVTFEDGIVLKYRTEYWVPVERGNLYKDGRKISEEELREYLGFTVSPRKVKNKLKTLTLEGIKKFLKKIDRKLYLTQLNEPKSTCNPICYSIDGIVGDIHIGEDGEVYGTLDYEGYDDNDYSEPYKIDDLYTGEVRSIYCKNKYGSAAHIQIDVDHLKESIAYSILRY